MAIEGVARHTLVRRGLRLNYATIGYNAFEALAALWAGFVAGSVALVGFGFDSLIELSASAAAQWRLRMDTSEDLRERVERLTHRVVGWCFVALAAYVAYESVQALREGVAPVRSVLGIVVLALSAVVMPLLAKAKRGVARALASRALEGEAAQTSLCAYLSLVALAGVALNAALGWWWADPVAALVMVPIIAHEGIERVYGEACDEESGARGAE